MTTNTTETAAPKDDGLQALREVGSEEKSQYWDRDDIMTALRQARLKGVRIESLYSYASRQVRKHGRHIKQAS
jgi:hypothetical protein